MILLLFFAGHIDMGINYYSHCGNWSESRGLVRSKRSMRKSLGHIEDMEERKEVEGLSISPGIPNRSV